MEQMLREKNEYWHLLLRSLFVRTYCPNAYGEKYTGRSKDKDSKASCIIELMSLPKSDLRKHLQTYNIFDEVGKMKFRFRISLDIRQDQNNIKM